MKTKTLNFTIVLILAIIIQSCNGCKNVLPPPQYFEMTFADVNNNNLLGSTFNQTSFKLHNSNSTVWLNYDPINQGESLKVQYKDIQTNLDYYLDLSDTDTDTLRVNFTTTEEKCYDSFEINSFTYNGQNLAFDQGVSFKVVKS